MINLQVLGRLELHADDGRVLHSVLAQPQRQGVLVYLAVAVPRGYHRRDTLVALFWPERADEQARSSLSKAVSHLRQTLGGDALLSRGHAELGLDWQLVWCDAAGFEEALDRGALAEAMALYRGDLLPGFHVDDAPDFDQWLERERARLRSRAVRASQLLSEREEVAGQLAPSIEWARRAAALDPFDESIVRRVMELLDKAGDRSGALRTYDEFTAFLLSELDAEPGAETTAVMASIRHRQVQVPAPPIEIPAGPSPVQTISPAAPPVVATAPAPPAGASIRAPWRSRIAALAVGAAAVATVAAWPVMQRNRAAASTDAPTAIVAVLPFVVEGDTAAADLGTNMVSLIAKRFNQEGALRALDATKVRPRTHPLRPDDAGADSARALIGNPPPRFVLLGHVTATGGAIHITAALFDSIPKRDPTARAAASGPAGDVARLSSEIAAQILLTQPTSRARRSPASTAELTPSLVALRAFLRGDRELAAGRFAEATAAFKTAVDADTTFALAYLSLSRAANWAGDFAMSEFAAQRALRNMDRLTPLDQLRARAWSAYQHGQPIEAERLTQLVIVNDVGRYEAWYDLGELRFHWGPILGWTIHDARDAYEQALAISNNDVGTMLHLARIAAAEGRTAAVDSLARRILALGADGPHALEVRALRAHALGDRAQVAQVNVALARLDDDAALSIASMVAVYGAEYPSAREVTDVLRLTRRSPRVRAAGTIMKAQLAMAHGHTSEAVRELASGANLTPARSLEYRAVIAALPFRATPPADALALREELLALRDEGLIGPSADHLAVNSIYPPRRSYLLAMLSLKANDTTGAARYAQPEQGAENRMDYTYRLAAARLVRAERLRMDGQPAQALEMLGAPSVLPGQSLPGVLHYPSAHERYLRAELLRDLGRWEDALRWYGTFPDPGGYDLMYLPAVSVAMGAAYEQAGNRDAARASHRRAVALLANADAEWSSLVTRARQGVAAAR